MKFQYIYIILFLSTFTWSCSDFLEVKPDNAFVINEVLDTPEDTREFLDGAYDALSFGSVYGGQFSLISELMTDGVYGENIINGDWLAHYTRSTDIFLGTTRSMFENAFQAVGRANNVLDQLDQIEGFSDVDKNYIEGEVKFIRALVHFDMVRFFAQPYGSVASNTQLGIAIRTTQSTDLVNRSTVQEVYNQIIQDLEDASTLLPESNSYYANAWAAKALLAKVYFQMNDFENAFSYAHDVIEMGPFELDTSFVNKYGYAPSNEVIFGLQSSHLDFDNANGSYRGYFRPDPSNLGLPQLFPSNELVVQFQTEPDKRFAAWFELAASGQFLCKKFAYDSVYTNPVIHLTELHLIRGEAALENLNVDQARTDVNLIKERAGVALVAPGAATAALFLALRTERHKELFFENNRMHELKRQAVRDSPNMTIRNAPWNCAGMVCQFPDNELKGNPNMEPNPQGGCN